MNQKKSILVTGSNGQLGSELKDLSSAYPSYDFYFADKEQLSIIDEGAVNHFFKSRQPDYCINCAAYTAVDKAEDPAELGLVTAVNADAVKYLSTACAKYDTKFIHISTDYVFDGNGAKPHKVDDITNPVSVYGTTKLEGEKNAAKYTDAIIIRTAWVYSSYGKNFVKTMVKLMRERLQLNVVSDQYGTPTYAADLALAIMLIIDSKKWLPGIYHYTDEGKISWFQFALAIKEITQADCELKPMQTADYPTAAKRPAWSVLDKSKIKEIYNLPIPDWKESLGICLAQLKAQNN